MEQGTRAPEAECGESIGHVDVGGEILPVTCDREPGHDGAHHPGSITINRASGPQMVPFTVDAVPLSSQTGDGYAPDAIKRVDALPGATMHATFEWIEGAPGE